jgi:hypothetical protein
MAATGTRGIGSCAASQFFERSFTPQDEIGENDAAVFDGAAIQRQLGVEPISGERFRFPERPREVKVKWIAVTDCDSLFLFYLQCGLPLLAIEFDLEARNLKRVAVKTGRVEIFRCVFREALGAVSAAPGGFSGAAWPFYHFDHW